MRVDSVSDMAQRSGIILNEKVSVREVVKSRSNYFVVRCGMMSTLCSMFYKRPTISIGITSNFQPISTRS